MTPQCSAIKANGARCKGPALDQRGLCWAHLPENAAHRRRTAAKGGRARASGLVEIEQIKDAIETTLDAVANGEQPNGTALFMGFNTWLRAVEVGRRVREADELLQRIEALEALESEGQSWPR